MSDRLLTDHLNRLADDVTQAPSPVADIIDAVSRKRASRVRIAAGVALAAIVVGGATVAMTQHSRSADTTAADRSTDRQQTDGPEQVQPSPAPERRHETVAPVSATKLQREGILVDHSDEVATITAQDAIRRARAEMTTADRPAPAAQLFRVTVTDYGKPDPSQPYGYDLIIEDRLAWVITFPKQRIYGSHTAWSDKASTGIAQTVTFIDATTGEFLMAESF